MNSFVHEELDDLVSQLKNAILNHSEWLVQWHKNIICMSRDSDPLRIDEDAHHNCEFGKWYYSISNERLRGLECLLRIEDIHRRMHRKENELALGFSMARQLNMECYDEFLILRAEFRSAVSELDAELHNLHDALHESILNVDVLTKVYNRRYMQYLLPKELERARRTNENCALVLSDLDKFKFVNDTYGHLAGDVVLKYFANFLSSHLRDGDFVFRYGGEEFIIYLPDIDVDAGAKIINRLRKKLMKEKIITDDHIAISITCSFGVASCRMGSSLEDIIRKADSALYESKALGRNRVTIAK